MDKELVPAMTFNHLVILHSSRQHQHSLGGAQLVFVKIHTSGMSPQLMKMKFHMVFHFIFLGFYFQM